MRGVTLPAAPSRVRGMASLQRRLNGLLLAAYRFGNHRARTDAERHWTARLIDGLEQTRDALAADSAGPRTPERS
jgi:hypothetical protein